MNTSDALPVTCKCSSSLLLNYMLCAYLLRSSCMEGVHDDLGTHKPRRDRVGKWQWLLTNRKDRAPYSHFLKPLSGKARSR